MLSVTVAETTGFAIPAAAGTLLALHGAPAPIVVPSMVLAGACEGALFGLGQWIGFGQPIVPRGAWTAVTAVGAALAWSFGMLVANAAGVVASDPFLMVVVSLLGVLLLLSMPTLQWVVLRRSGHQAKWWIPGNAAAWAIGILWTFAPSPFIDETTPFLVLFGVYAAAGLFMAASVAAVSGIAASRLLAADQTLPPRSSRSVHG